MAQLWKHPASTPFTDTLEFLLVFWYEPGQSGPVLPRGIELTRAITTLTETVPYQGTQFFRLIPNLGPTRNGSVSAG